MNTKKRLSLAMMILFAIARSSHAQTTFTQITTGDIVSDLGTFTRPVWADFNNDGFLDLFVSNWGQQTNVFYLNNGDGTFTKRTQGNPVQDADYHSGCAAGDYDNDGHLDLLVSAGVLAPSARRNALYHNNGDGTFDLVSGGALNNSLGYFDACAWADFDNDGFLDFVMTENPGSGGKTLLFHNNRDGSFTQQASGPPLSDVSAGQGVLWADYDNDGWMDLLVINTINNGHNFLYRNSRNGSFIRITTNAIASDAWSAGAVGGAWGDYDNDGLPDLFITDGAGQSNRLYHNNGNGVFTNVTTGPMLTPLPGSSPQGCAWGDYDNDGYLDLFVSNPEGQNGLFHNNGDGTFSEIDTESPVNGPACMSVAWVDYDNDGSLDLFLTRALFDGTLISNLLYHNNGSTNAWLEVKLVGTVANRSAIGAKVRVQATIGGKTFWQMREINNGGGWNIQPLVAHFGLGDATKAQTLRIEWPSGTVQEFDNVAARQILTLVEPARLAATSTNGLPQFTLHGGRNLQYDLQGSSDLQAWSTLGTIVISNVDGTALIPEAIAAGADTRFYRAASR
jgi:enediyne biosynthesis protein E4